MIENNDYDENGIHKITKTPYDIHGFDVTGYNTYTNSEYDSFGYAQDGYNKEGYGKDSFDRHGYDRAGYDKDGYYRDGYNENGYDKSGYGRDGYNKNNWNFLGINKKTLSSYNDAGYDRDGYDQDGYNKNGYDHEGFSRDGYDKNGYNKKRFHRNDYTENGSIRHVIIRENISDSIEKITYNIEEKLVGTYNKNGYVSSYWGVPYEEFLKYVNSKNHSKFRKEHFGNYETSSNLTLHPIPKDRAEKFCIPYRVLLPNQNLSTSTDWNSAGLSYAMFYALGARPYMFSRYSFEEVNEILSEFNMIAGPALPELGRLGQQTIIRLNKRLSEYNIEHAAQLATAYPGGRLQSYASIFNAIWVRQVSPQLCELLS